MIAFEYTIEGVEFKETAAFLCETDLKDITMLVIVK
jgi:hypothetical protein